MSEPERRWAERVVDGLSRARVAGAGNEGALESVSANSSISSMRRLARSDAEFELALEAVERVKNEQELTPQHYACLESIIEPYGRPVIDIVANRYQEAPESWPLLDDATTRKMLEDVIPAVGRVDLIGHPRMPYAGTAFCVGPRLMMTNRHVAEYFAEGYGQDNITFKPGMASIIDLKQEVVPTPVARQLKVVRVVMIHPYWDCALLEVAGDEPLVPLALCETEPSTIKGVPIAVIGYPARDPRGDIETQQRIFRVFDKKRLQPGVLLGYGRMQSYGDEVATLEHDASTLGGNSGSSVIDLASGHVLALHFAGEPRVANHAIPMWELAKDPRVVDAGVSFVKRPERVQQVSWDYKWATTRPGSGGPPVATREKVGAAPPRPAGAAAGGTLMWWGGRL